MSNETYILEPATTNCLMSLVSQLNGEDPEIYTPACTSKVVAGLAYGSNDLLDDNPRQELLPLAWELLNTDCDKCEKLRMVKTIEYCFKKIVPKILRDNNYYVYAKELEKSNTLLELLSNSQPLFYLKLPLNYYDYDDKYEGYDERYFSTFCFDAWRGVFKNPKIKNVKKIRENHYEAHWQSRAGESIAYLMCHVYGTEDATPYIKLIKYVIELCPHYMEWKLPKQNVNEYVKQEELALI